MESWKTALLDKQKLSTRKYRCSWGQCNSDSRYYHKREDLKNVFFLKFPKKNKEREKCLIWIKACNRPHTQLNIDKLQSFHYVCSKHFVGGCGPSDNHPNPLTADNYCKKEQTGRKKPKLREPLLNKTGKKRTISKKDAAQALLDLGNISQDVPNSNDNEL